MPAGGVRCLEWWQPCPAEDFPLEWIALWASRFRLVLPHGFMPSSGFAIAATMVPAMAKDAGRESDGVQGDSPPIRHMPSAPVRTQKRHLTCAFSVTSPAATGTGTRSGDAFKEPAPLTVVASPLPVGAGNWGSASRAVGPSVTARPVGVPFCRTPPKGPCLGSSRLPSPACRGRRHAGRPRHGSCCLRWPLH